MVIFIFGSFTEYFLKELFKIHDSYEEIPFFIRLNIRITLGISLILVLGSFASIFKILNQLYTIIAIIVVSVCYFLTIILKKKYKFNWKHEAVKILPIILLLTSGSLLRISTLGLNGAIFPGSDVKFHSMYVELICFNKGFSETLDPFVHQIADYPPGFHMVVAFFSTAIGQLSTITLTVFICFVYSLIGLGIYSITYALSKSEIASFISALSVLFLDGEISLIPFWGGVTLLTAFYFTSIFLSLFYFNDVRFSKFFECIAGIAFCIAFITNTGLALMGLLLLVPLVLKRVLSNPPSFHMKTCLKSAISPFLISVFVYLFIVSPLIIPAVKLVLGLVPRDLLAPQGPTGVLTWGAEWYYPENFMHQLILNHGFFVATLFIVNIIVSVFLVSIYLMKRASKLSGIVFSYCSVFFWTLIIVIFGVNNPEGLFFLKFPSWDLFVPSRMFTYLLFPFCVLAGLLFDFVLVGGKWVFTRNNHQRHLKGIRYIFITVVIILVASSILACYTDIKNNQLNELCARSNIPISDDDLRCFEWIKKNTSLCDRFLVETSDAGQYIPAYCDRAVIYPFTLVQYDSDYTKLKNEMYVDPDGDEALNLLNKLEISYVFVGSKIDWWYYNATFNGDLLRASLHYQLVFSSGQSLIFKVKR